MTADQSAERSLALRLRELGPSKAVSTFLSGYGNLRTRSHYASDLCLYFRWLRGRGVAMGPDDLVKDNLRAVFESAPTDTEAKRKHTDLLAEYVNGYLLERRFSDSRRKVAETAIRQFYLANDSALFGHWKMAEQKPTAPPPPLPAGDIRKVLLAMPVRMRAPGFGVAVGHRNQQGA